MAQMMWAIWLSVKILVVMNCFYRAEVFGNFETLKQATSVAGELLALTGLRNPYEGKQGVVEEGALADFVVS